MKNHHNGLKFQIQNLSDENKKDLKKRNKVFNKIKKLKKLQDEDWTKARHTEILDLQNSLNL
jgi:hypothetical protein